MVRTMADRRDLWKPTASASPWIGNGENASVAV